MTDIARAARRASRGDAMEWGARLGLAARACIYLLMGVLALALAAGKSNSETDQRGALTTVARHTGGQLLLVLLAVGFAGYALWRFSEAAFGVVGDGNGAGPRLKSVIRGLVYASFAATTVAILTSSSGGAGKQSQAAQQAGITARVMRQTGGRYLVGLAGVIVLIVGGVMVYEGATRKFEKYLRMSDMGSPTRSLVEKLGMVGTIARGVVIGLAGLLVVDAAVTFRPSKARGLDGALRTLAAQPYGRVLLSAAALGLIAFGIYGFAEARWHRT